MPPSLDDAIGHRVSLRGTVGSPNRLLPNHAFALHAPDGRGLIVRLASAHRIPPQGSDIRIIGTLKFDTKEFPYLSVAAKDGIDLLGASSTVRTRPVDWLAPSLEDAWSWVAATGTVVSATGNAVRLLVDDADVGLKIRAPVRYRASRLKAGDTVRVTGLADISGDQPAIIPRSADDIAIIAHAPEKQALSASPSTPVPGALPNWTPFGAAAMAVGGIEAVKKIRTVKKRTAAAKKTA